MEGITVRKIDGHIFLNFLKDAIWIEVQHDPKYQYYLTPAGMVVKVLIDSEMLSNGVVSSVTFRIVEVFSNFKLG